MITSVAWTPPGTTELNRRPARLKLPALGRTTTGRATTGPSRKDATSTAAWPTYCGTKGWGGVLGKVTNHDAPQQHQQHRSRTNSKVGTFHRRFALLHSRIGLRLTWRLPRVSGSSLLTLKTANQRRKPGAASSIAPRAKRVDMNLAGSPTGAQKCVIKQQQQRRKKKWGARLWNPFFASLVHPTQAFFTHTHTHTHTHCLRTPKH